MTLTLRYGARSDVGLLREGNEDSLYAGPRLLAVADGMGGHAAGEVASAVAIATLAALDEDAPGADLIAALRDAVTAANNHLRDMVNADSELEGMGTTLTALLWAGQRLGLVHVGDSRAYLLRDGTLSQITHDHTLVQSLIDEGRITPEEATTHPQRSWITRALDGRGDVEPDVSVREVRDGDRYLLCTDGLSGVVSEDTLRETLAVGTPQESCDRLIDLALRGGGPDNVTCIVADVVDSGSTEVEPIVAGAAAENNGQSAPSPDHAAGRAALAQAKPAPVEPVRERDLRELPERRGRGVRRVAVVVGVVVVLLAAATTASWAYIRSQFYVGPAHGNVAIFRGIEGKVAGVRLSTVRERSNLPVSALQDFEAQRVTQGIAAAGLGDAHRIVEGLRRQACPSPTPTPSPKPTKPTPTPRPTAAAKPAPTPTSKRPVTASPTPSPTPSPWCEDPR